MASIWDAHNFICSTFVLSDSTVTKVAPKGAPVPEYNLNVYMDIIYMDITMDRAQRCHFSRNFLPL